MTKYREVLHTNFFFGSTYENGADCHWNIIKNIFKQMNINIHGYRLPGRREKITEITYKT